MVLEFPHESTAVFSREDCSPSIGGLHPCHAIVTRLSRHAVPMNEALSLPLHQGIALLLRIKVKMFIIKKYVYWSIALMLGNTYLCIDACRWKVDGKPSWSLLIKNISNTHELQKTCLALIATVQHQCLGTNLSGERTDYGERHP